MLLEYYKSRIDIENRIDNTPLVISDEERKHGKVKKDFIRIFIII